MAYKYYRMDTSFMSNEHRAELLESISKCVGVGWTGWTGVPSIFKLTWDNKYDFYDLVLHADECELSPWEFY